MLACLKAAAKDFIVCESLVDFTAELNFWMWCKDWANLFRNVAWVWTCDKLCSNCASLCAGLGVAGVFSSDRDFIVCMSWLVGVNRERTAIKPQKEKKTFIVVVGVLENSNFDYRFEY